MKKSYLVVTAEIIREEALRYAKAGDTSAAWRIESALSALTNYCYHSKYDGKVSNEEFDAVKSIYFDCSDAIEEAWRDSEDCARLKKWLADPANRNDINYSDIYKDVYGHRPR